MSRRKDFKNLKDWYDRLKSIRDEYVPVWQEIGKYVGIRVDPDYTYNQHTDKSDILDYLVDDPTASISVNQSGDYLQGVVWGSGDNVLTIEPSDALLETVDKSNISDYFKFISKRVLAQMNHSEAGLNAAFKPYFYDQIAFGTSGVGSFPNNKFGIDDNALIFRNYGVDNIAIDEGRNGLVNVIFVTYQWRVNRIVSEFAFRQGVLDEKLFNKLPKGVREDYSKDNVNKEYTLIHAIYPREDFMPRLKGKRGTRYIGEWFLDDETDNIFLKEDYKTLPIGVCRAIKIRGEMYGRSSGSILISTIKSVNYMISKTIMILEKMESPALGTWNNAIFGDTVLDTSPDALSIFNTASGPEGAPPIFKLQDTGDPTGVISFLIPYLNDKIATAFKTDILLDFNSAKEMTATESLQRFVIRGKSLAGLLQQQKVEMLEPVTHRSISLLGQMGLLGVNPLANKTVAQRLRDLDKGEQIIPDSVLKMMVAGERWYKLTFNNELEKLSRTEKIENILKALNFLTGMAALFPGILQGVEWYKMWQDVNDFLGISYTIDEDEFKAIIAKEAEMRRQAILLQAQQQGAQINKDMAGAEKDRSTADVQEAQA